MKTSILSALAAVSAVAVASPASAAETFFQGSTDGCFGVACSAASTATTGGLTFRDSTFSGTTASGFLGIGASVGTPNLNNLGSFTLTGDPATYTGTTFELLVFFTQPAGTSPSSRRISSLLTGTVMADATGGIFVDFDNNAQNFTFNGGSFTFSVNDVSLLAGQSAPITGTIIAQSAVPEPGTWAMMLMGFGAIGLGMRRRGQGKMLQAA